jgi:hypothetical protein
VTLNPLRYIVARELLSRGSKMAIPLIVPALHALGHGIHLLFHAKAAVVVHHGLGVHATGAAGTGASSTASGTVVSAGGAAAHGTMATHGAVAAHGTMATHGAAASPTFGAIGVDPTLSRQLDASSLLEILKNQGTATSNADPSLITDKLQTALQAGNLNPIQYATKLRDLLVSIGTKPEVANEVLARLIDPSSRL